MAAESFKKYRQVLEEMAALAATRKTSYQLGVQVFSENPVTSNCPVYVAGRTLSKLQTEWGGSMLRDDPVWILIQGPLHFLWNFVREDSACHLQELWEQTLLAEVQGITDQQAIQQLLFDEGGLARKFVAGPAAPFLGRNLKGFYATSAFESSLPFDQAFLNFISKGSVSRLAARAGYSVTIEGQPTTANSGARLQPHATHLEMQCGSIRTELNNYNFPVRQVFAWSPNECDNVTLQIEVGTLLLTKRYEGNTALPQFLQEFQNGKRTFTLLDFPDKGQELKKLGITDIQVGYRISGQQAVMQMSNASGRARLDLIPQRIVECRVQ